MIKEQLPDSWIVTPLSEIAAINPTIDKRNIDDETLVSFVPMPAVEAESGRIDISICRRFKEVKKGYTGFLERDVIFAKITPCMENGKAAVIPKLQNDLGFGSTEFHVIRAPVGISPELLYYYVSSKWFRVEAEHNMTGAVGQRRVPTSFLEATPFPLPPTNEQKRIVAKIEELFSELDNGIAALKTAREQLKVYRQAVLKHAFEGKLTAKWREDKVNGEAREGGLGRNADKLESPEQLLARIQQEREARYQQQLEEWKAAVKAWEANGKGGKKPGKPRMNQYDIELDEEDRQRLPQLPDSWMWLPLNELISGLPRSMQSGPFGSNLKHSEFTTSGKLVIGIDNVKDGYFTIGSENRISEEKFEELEKYEARPGDLLVTVMASLGRTCVVPRDIEQAIITKHVYRISMEQHLLYPEFYNYLLQSHTVSRLRMFENAQGQTRPGLNSTILKELPVPLCHIDEQKLIVEYIEEKLSGIVNFDNEINNALKRAESLRQSILKKAFSGQLVPQDPNDEPASELLARIQAEKAAEKASQKASAKPKATAKPGAKRDRKTKEAKA